MKGYITKKQIAIIVAILVVFLLTVVSIISMKQDDELFVIDKTNDQFVFYQSLDGKYKDCGSEELSEGYGYNKKMRECFISSLDSCSFAKMYQKLATVDGDPIFTTMIIDGEKERGCATQIYIDSFNSYGGRSKYNTECYSVDDSVGTGQKSLFLDQCSGGTQHFFY